MHFKYLVGKNLKEILINLTLECQFSQILPLVSFDLTSEKQYLFCHDGLQTVLTHTILRESRA